MRTAALTTVIAAALAAAACTSTQTGQASPTSGQTSGSSASSSPSSGSTNGLVGLNACTLLTDDEARQVAPGAGTHTDNGELGGAGTSDCEWTKPVTNGTGGVTFGITVRPAQGLKDIVLKPRGKRTDTTSPGGRQAAVVTNNEGEGSCAAVIAVGSGRIDINAATVHGTTQEMCTVVDKVIEYVEPKLPAS
ncbi:DUF3558 family protein [Amycolatopsis taiwanensis]|uniref:DUF3558 domain-containing protein n=1 Tax=Amycolatopsis taiwanensis TaxID=342230 RepID=A0A9W6QXP3_9PSEU|nr:DUF3558 family protein [Amycolatopsis taiwanensis]GLY63912.1 hypothetical protein Atai01_05310 [Amycolatopsis taiwanensis]